MITSQLITSQVTEYVTSNLHEAHVACESSFKERFGICGRTHLLYMNKSYKRVLRIKIAKI